MLRFLYETVGGRLILKLLTTRTLSRIVGRFMDSKMSRCLVPFFVKANHINLSECEKQHFRSFNDCFTREVREGARSFDPDETKLLSPSDADLSVYTIKKDTVIPVKQSRYTIDDLLRDPEDAERFYDGYCIVFRLSVHHYHRYGYAVSGKKDKDRFIRGILHTVQPIALRSVPVFTENCRSISRIHSQRFGEVAQIEVGAMLVGKIRNFQSGEAMAVRGERKGMFLYGGSTVILLMQKDKVKLRDEFFDNTEKGIETPVRYGESIGVSLT